MYVTKHFYWSKASFSLYRTFGLLAPTGALIVMMVYYTYTRSLGAPIRRTVLPALRPLRPVSDPLNVSPAIQG